VVIIGIDPPKRTHTASALHPDTSRVLATMQIDASLNGYRRLLTWAAGFDQRRWAVENARGLGRHLAQWLLARGEAVDDVPSTATARVRELSRGGRHKNDVIDAAAAASVAALRGEANPVAAEDLTALLALLDERRHNVITQRTRLINQLHALLRDLVPGGAPTNLTVLAASRLLITVRAAGPVEAARKQLARDLLAEIRQADQRLKTLTGKIAATVAEHGSQLPTVEGIGPIIAGRLLGRTRRASRFPNASAFANYTGVAPVEVVSGDHARHRLPRGGDRQLNLALHLIARTPSTHASKPGPRLLRHENRRRQDLQRSHALPKTTPGRSRLADHDRRRTATGGEPGRTIGGDSAIQRGWLNPDHQLFGQVTSRAHRPQLYDTATDGLTKPEEPRVSYPFPILGRMARYQAGATAGRALSTCRTSDC
jgi:transposase